VYSKEEADEAGIEYREDWWDAQRGDWALTDDGWVMQLCADSEMKNRRAKARTLRFSGASVIVKWHAVDEYESFDGTLRYEAYRKAKKHYNTMNPAIPWHYRVGGRQGTKRAVFMYVQFRLSTYHGRLTEEQWLRCGMLYAPKDKIPQASFRLFLRTHTAKQMVAEEMRRALLDNNVTVDFVIKKLLKAIDMAEKDGKAKDVREGAERLLTLMERIEGRMPEETGVETQWKQLPAGTDKDGPEFRRPELPEPIDRADDPMAVKPPDDED
jgi:hypothetical protein